MTVRVTARAAPQIAHEMGTHLKRSPIFIPALSKSSNILFAIGSPQKLDLRLPVLTSGLIEFPNQAGSDRQ